MFEKRELELRHFLFNTLLGKCCSIYGSFSLRLHSSACWKIHSCSKMMSRNVQVFFFFFFFCEDPYVELCCNSFKCSWSATSHTRSEMCIVTARGRISLASVPTISKQSRDSRENGNACSHSPHHTWNYIAGLTLNSSTWIQWLVCVNIDTVDVLVTSVWAGAFFA